MTRKRIVRTSGRWLVLVAVLVAAGCSSASPAPAPKLATQVPTAPTLPAGETAGRLPAVVAELSFAPAGSDAYEPSDIAFDEAGQAVVLCESGLLLLDPMEGARGPLWPIPGSPGAGFAVAGGLAYVGYQVPRGTDRLAAVDLATGELRADQEAVGIRTYDHASLAAGSNGRIYAAAGDTVEMRDGATLEVLQTLRFGWGDTPTLALDAPRDRLYVLGAQQIRAYRAADLQLLWQVDTPRASIRRLVVDEDGRRLYAVPLQSEGYPEASRLQVFSAESGQALPPIAVQVPSWELVAREVGRTLPPIPPQTPGWDLVAADGQAGRLVFAAYTPLGTHLWQTDGEGRPTGRSSMRAGIAGPYSGHGGRIAGLLGERHQVEVVDAATLRTVSRITTGVLIRNLVADASHERVYLNDSAGTLRVLDARTNRVLASLEGVGSGAMALDAANQLLFVSDSRWRFAPAVVDTAALTVSAVITGGDRVALDAAGHRAFVGALPPWTDEVQVWDTRTFRRLGAIARGGAPTYNPLRDEVYVLTERGVDIADGKSLALTGALLEGLSPQPRPDAPVACDNCLTVRGMAVDPGQEVIAVELAFASARASGALPEPRLFSARTLAPVTGTVSLFTHRAGGVPLIMPPDEGRIYVTECEQHYGGWVECLRTRTRQAGSDEVLASPEGLCPDLVLPGTGMALTLRGGDAMVYDSRTWEPLGRIPYRGNLEVDLAGRRLYTWGGSWLTILGFSGGQPLAPEPAEPWPAGQPFGWVLEIHFSPDYARDRTIFVVTESEVLRTTDGGRTWARLRGGLPGGGRMIIGAAASYSLALSPAFGQDHTLFLAGPPTTGIWRSTDGGDHWAPCWRQLGDLTVLRLAISPHYAQDHTVLAQTEGTLFRSEDGGTTWSADGASKRLQGPPLYSPEEAFPGPPPAVQSKIVNYAQLQRSADGGQTWQTVLVDREQKSFVAVLRSPRLASDGQVFALCAGALYRSTDGGVTWQVASSAAVAPAQAWGMFTALALGSEQDGSLRLALGEQDGHLSILDPRTIPWEPVPG